MTILLLQIAYLKLLILKFEKNKYCIRLSNKYVNAVLRILISNMKADINELAGKIQPQKLLKKINIYIILYLRIK